MDHSGLIAAIEADFRGRLPSYHKSRREGLSVLAGVLLEVRSANLIELAAGLPRAIGAADDRYQYIERQLMNPAIDTDTVIKAYASEVITRLAARGETIILQIDQSHINALNKVLMVSMRLRKRALPIGWRVRSTQGNIGFAVQQELLDSIKAWLPEGVAVMLATDRFYGTAKLIDWCQKAGWGYRIRLKGNLTLMHQGGELTTGKVITQSPEGVLGAELWGSGVITNIGTLHEKGHKEAWIIAMDAKPSRSTGRSHAGPLPNSKPPIAA